MTHEVVGINIFILSNHIQVKYIFIIIIPKHEIKIQKNKYKTIIQTFFNKNPLEEIYFYTNPKTFSK